MYPTKYGKLSLSHRSLPNKVNSRDLNGVHMIISMRTILLISSEVTALPSSRNGGRWAGMHSFIRLSDTYGLLHSLLKFRYNRRKRGSAPVSDQ